MLAYASKALQAGEKPASPTLARKAVKLFTQSMDEAGFGEGKAGPGRPRKDAEMDADFPEGDLIARALRLAFVGGEGEGDDSA